MHINSNSPVCPPASTVVENKAEGRGLIVIIGIAALATLAYNKTSRT